ncbi:MAG: hypothetical protein K8S87_00170 [Planctomycetes bacterium]|nr:hypothetical protein [Planctomycetota bacterium]
MLIKISTSTSLSLLTFVVFTILILGCSSIDDDAQSIGLKTRAELDAYFIIQKNPNVDNKFVTHFAKVNLVQGNTVIIGAVTSVNYDLPNSQRGTIEVFQNLWGTKLQKSINVYSSEIGFLEACPGEQLFVLRTFANNSNSKVITNFQLNPGIREHQIKTTREILKLENIEGFQARKKNLVEKCFSALKGDNVWVANAWSFQLFHFCNDYPDYMKFEHLAKLKKLELEYVRNRPYANEVLKILKATIILLLKNKFKRIWLESMLNANAVDARKSAELLNFWISNSYRKAFDIEDRIVVNSLMELVINPKILEMLMDIESNIREILSGM